MLANKLTAIKKMPFFALRNDLAFFEREKKTERHSCLTTSDVLVRAELEIKRLIE